MLKITISILVGICLGLYFNIALLFFALFITFYIFKSSNNNLIYVLVGVIVFIYVILGELKYNKVNNFMSDIENQSVNIIAKVISNKEEMPIVKNDIAVGDIDDIKINISSCCKPIPGDDIIGYITKGYGINVHRKNCPNIEDLHERIIEVKWSDLIVKKYPTGVIIRSLKNDNLLLDVISKTQNGKITIQKVNTFNEVDQTVISMTVLVENKDVLIKFMNDIKSIPNVLSVERVIK